MPLSHSCQVISTCFGPAEKKKHTKKTLKSTACLLPTWNGSENPMFGICPHRKADLRVRHTSQVQRIFSPL